MPVYSRAGPWRIVASVVLSSLMAVPAGAITRELPYGPLFTGPATRPIDGEDSNWPPTVTANHDKYTGHHTFAEYTADRKRRVLSMKAGDRLSADDLEAGVAIAADSGRKPMRKVE